MRTVSYFQPVDILDRLIIAMKVNAKATGVYLPSLWGVIRQVKGTKQPRVFRMRIQRSV
jgi:hypothetical protein